MRALRVDVKRDGARATVGGSFGEIFFEIEDPDFVIERDEFAVWAALPIAMATGAHLEFDVPIDPAVADSAHRLSRIWNAWLPKRSHMVQIEAPPAKRRAAASDRHVMAYSGGGDSTYALLRHREEHNIGRLFTMLGFDFPFSAEPMFRRLVDKNRRNAEAFGLALTTLRTNVFDKNLPWKHNHIISLASVIWLFAGRYARGHFAGDVARYQDFLTFPWGSNGVTNRCFQGSDFGIDPFADDVTRSEKIAVLLDQPDVARNVTLCPMAANIGRNCGRCSKCIRNKLMCIAERGTCQPLFSDDRVTDADFARLTKDRRGGHAQLMIRELHQSFLLKHDKEMAARMEAMIVPNKDIVAGRETPPPWWRVNLNLRKRLGLRRR